MQKRLFSYVGSEPKTVSTLLQQPLAAIRGSEEGKGWAGVGRVAVPTNFGG